MVTGIEAALSSEPSASSVGDSVTVSPSDARQQSVCIIEDDIAVREALAAMLEARGLSVTLYGSAESFLAAADARDGCLLVDFNLPGMSGLALLAKLAAERSPPPMIVMSGRADAALSDAATQAGALCTIAKPIDPEALIAALRQAGIRFPSVV